MDLSRPIQYRGLNLNDAAPEAGTGRLKGIQIDDAAIGQVNGVGYTEKRSQGDGRDASDVFLDGRQFALGGTVFGKTRAEAHDAFQALRAALTPTAAYRSQPGDYGYVPLSWQEPTTDIRFVEDTPGSGIRWRSMYANVRPMFTPEQRIIRDRAGGRASLGVGFQFQVMFAAKDPRLYVSPEALLDYTDGATTQTGVFLNRGTYPAPLNILLVVDPPHATAGQYQLDTGGSLLRINLPASTNQQVFRYDGTLKILTLQELGIESLRMDLLSFANEVTHPLIASTPPSGAGSTGQPWTWITTATGAFIATPLSANSRMWFNEAFA